MSETYNLYFDQTFYANLEYISKLLEIADNYDYLSKEEISSLTGIPTGASSGKVVPHIMYCKYMNLINLDTSSSGYKFNKTKLGELIYSEDQYFMEEVTKILCHYFLTSGLTGAELWFRLFRVLPRALGRKIKESIVIKELEQYYNKNIKLTALKGCYSNTNSFMDLNVLKLNGDYFEFKALYYLDEQSYALAYTLVRELEEMDKNRKEFTIDEVLEVLYWQNAFGWDNYFAMEVIEKFKSKGIITLNRQLVPTTIILNQSSESLLNKIYSLLI